MGYKVDGKRENYRRVLLGAHAVQRLQQRINLHSSERFHSRVSFGGESLNNLLIHFFQVFPFNWRIATMMRE